MNTNFKFLFQKVDIDYNNVDLYGALEASFTYKIIEVNAQFSLNDTEMNNILSNVTDVVVNRRHSMEKLFSNILQVYSDFILEKQPTSVADAMSIYEDISTNFGSKDDQYNYASPKYAQLLPIKIV